MINSNNNKIRRNNKQQQQRQQTTNPLRAIRRGKSAPITSTCQSSSSGSATPAQQQQQHGRHQLQWHKRTGAGYALFVEYYSRQPAGCCYAALHHEEQEREGRGEQEEEISAVRDPTTTVVTTGGLQGQEVFSAKASRPKRQRMATSKQQHQVQQDDVGDDHDDDHDEDNDKDKMNVLVHNDPKENADPITSAKGPFMHHPPTLGGQRGGDSGRGLSRASKRRRKQQHKEEQQQQRRQVQQPQEPVVGASVAACSDSGAPFHPQRLQPHGKQQGRERGEILRRRKDHMESRPALRSASSTKTLSSDQRHSILKVWHSFRSCYDLANKNIKDRLCGMGNDSHHRRTTTACDLHQHEHHCRQMGVFFTAMSQPLPCTFRIRSSADPERVESFWQQYNTIVTTTNISSGTATAFCSFQPLPFGNSRIYQTVDCRHDPVGGTIWHKAILPPEIRALLMEYSSNGVVARQEIGSMLPVLLLHAAGYLPVDEKCNGGVAHATAAAAHNDIKTGNHNRNHSSRLSKESSLSSPLRILDMCASPGSKTMQILEGLMVIMANMDVDNKNNNKTTGRSQTATTRKMSQQKIRYNTHSNNSNSSGTQTTYMLDESPSKLSSTLQPTPTAARLPPAVLIANDIHPGRLAALQDALDRSGMLSDSSNKDSNNASSSLSWLKLTCHDASQFPNPVGASGTGKPIPYRVIVCDVPCSGDGTIRKDMSILPMWTPHHGNALHLLQLQILERALELVSDDNGIVCYSTCSLNPVENEAVVAAAVSNYRFNQEIKQRQRQQRQQGWQRNKQYPDSTTTTTTTTTKVELVEFPHVEGFVHRPGMQHWKVADYDLNDNDDSNNHYDRSSNKYDDKDNDHDHDTVNRNIQNDDDDDDDETPRLRWYNVWDDVVDEQRHQQRNNGGGGRLVPSQFPEYRHRHRSNHHHDADHGSNDDDDVPVLLDRCIRLFPQDYNTGGFFVALLRKTQTHNRPS